MSKISSAASSVGSAFSSVIGGVGDLFKGPDFPDPPPIEPPTEIPDTDTLDDALARQAVRRQRAGRGGFESTLLTGLGGGGSNLGVG